MVYILNFAVLLFVLVGCSSPSILEGEVVSSKIIGQGITEHLIQTKNETIPFFKIRTNQNTFYQGAKVSIELP